jgi:hypothetical protein
MSKSEKNHVDEWLQKQIKKGIDIIKSVLNNDKNESVLYYTGHLQKDILENFPGRRSKKIFKGYRELLDNNNLVFTQKRFEEHGYEYYVKKGI